MAAEKKAPPIKWLLECSDNEVGNFELVKLSEVANMRREMLELFDKLVDMSAQAVLAAWLRTIDRNELRRQLLQSPNTTIERIMSDAKAEIRSQGRPEELEVGPMPSPGFLLALPPEEAKARRRASRERWREGAVEKGLCEVCGKPQCRESARLCKKHLKTKIERQRERNGTIYSHGKAPGTLKALRLLAEKRAKQVRLLGPDPPKK